MCIRDRYQRRVHGKKLAEKRLRIKGKFVTSEQALAMLGTTREELQKNKEIQQVAHSTTNCSIKTGNKNIKVRNIHRLLDSENAQDCNSAVLDPPGVLKSSKSVEISLSVDPSKQCILQESSSSKKEKVKRKEEEKEALSQR
eukprot:TRINITY_DN4419_c0_g1_i4.p1 TRINITY_DN4419_c0_g1~~TRINITY_DN4419_c0_g1_i4.p1  ORF type:complete len:142 (+),score=35.61 TRINITY_DN4419_c0_g1_i4:161-586(+)